MPPAKFDFLARTITSSILALVIVGLAGYEVIRGQFTSPLISWAGVVIGVYFGYHVAKNGSDASAEDTTLRTMERVISNLQDNDADKPPA